MRVPGFEQLGALSRQAPVRAGSMDDEPRYRAWVGKSRRPSRRPTSPGAESRSVGWTAATTLLSRAISFAPACGPRERRARP
jgi:hypothetical protein